LVCGEDGYGGVATGVANVGGGDGVICVATDDAVDFGTVCDVVAGGDVGGIGVAVGGVGVSVGVGAGGGVGGVCVVVIVGGVDMYVDDDGYSVGNVSDVAGVVAHIHAGTGSRR